jgi:hypothetical protein
MVLQVREVLFQLLDKNGRIKSAIFISKVKEVCGDTYSDSELKKLLKVSCTMF